MKRRSTIIKSTHTTLKYSNKGKLSGLELLTAEYRNVMRQMVDLLWVQSKVPALIPKETTEQITTWLSARMVQCAAKQASGVVRGTRKKQAQRLFVIDKLKTQGKIVEADKLTKIYNSNTPTKPKINHVVLELDERFVKFDMKNKTSFDGWLTIGSIASRNSPYSGMKIQLPFKRNKHFNKLHNEMTMSKGIRLSESEVTFMFEKEKSPIKTTGKIIGIDVGKTTTITTSTGFASAKNRTGHDLNTIIELLSRKKKGSKAFARGQRYRKNYINWVINQLDLSNVKQLNIENIKDLRRNKKTNRTLSHWTYTEIFGKLVSYCAEQDVLVHKVEPAFTSQRCSCCGWVEKTNRNGKVFNCIACGFTEDADKNAAINIGLDLSPMVTSHMRLNSAGFYWQTTGQVQNVVPVAQEIF